MVKELLPTEFTERLALSKVYIYALVDPSSSKIRYIGKTKSLRLRLRGHINSILERNHKANWVQSLKSRGLLPTLEILDEVPEKKWKFFERAYIKLYRELGFNLVNMTDGGDGGLTRGFSGKKHSAASREKMSLSHSGKPGKRHTEETRKKISDSKKGKPGRKLSDKERKELSLSRAGDKNPNFGKPSPFKGKKHSPSALEKMSKNNAGENNPSFGVKQSKDTICKRIATRRKNKLLGRKYRDGG